MSEQNEPADSMPSFAPGVALRSAEFTEQVKSLRDQAAAEGTLAFDPFDPRFHDDPFSLYAELRAANPTHRSPLGFWVFTRHRDCLSMLRDKRSSSDARNMDADALMVGPTDEMDPMEQVLAEMAPFLFRDPPDHTRLRGLVQKAFTPRVVEGLRPRVEQICDELIARMLEREEGDLVADFAYPLPVQIIADMLGVPAADHDQFKGWSDALARGLDPDFLLPPEAVQDRMRAIMGFVQYFSGLIEDRRRNLGDDVLSGLVTAEENGVTLTQGELLSTCILLLVAGHETTVNLISSGALELLRHPDQLTRFRDDPGVTRSGIEEMMRYCSPVQLTGRAALEDIEIGGVTVKKGEFSMLLIGSANRDPDVFADPDTFDIGRTDNNHLGFGFGVHHCLGAALARIEAQEALSKLVRAARRIEPSTDDLRYRDNIILRGLASLPVTLTR